TICYHRKGILSVIGSTSARSSVLVDIDDDGDLDLVTNEMNDSPQILISDLSERRKVKFLKLRLIGTRSNRDGVGGRVKVSAGNAVMTQWRDGKSGYLAQSSLPLYFGLGEAESINEI